MTTRRSTSTPYEHGTARPGRAALGVLYLVLYPVPGSPLPGRMPVGVVIQGVIYGTSYALLGMGLILIYRTTRIVNFAYGAMGAHARRPRRRALRRQAACNYFVASSSASSSACVVGALVELLVIRRFANSSRLVLTVATIGLAQVLGGHRARCSQAASAPICSSAASRRRSARSFTVRPYLIRGDHILIARVGAARPRRAGVVPAAAPTPASPCAAAAENSDRALLLGIPVRPPADDRVGHRRRAGDDHLHARRRRSPGVPPDAGVSATALLPGLAAAVVAAHGVAAGRLRRPASASASSSGRALERHGRRRSSTSRSSS